MRDKSKVINMKNQLQQAADQAIYFPGAKAFRDWLHEHYRSASEVLVGFYKVSSGQPSMSWSESVDEALCVGWIDGIRKSVDDQRYTIRFTPRKPGSIWSRINIDKVTKLQQEGRMMPEGLAAFEGRTTGKSVIYSYETGGDDWPKGFLALFRKDKTAWRNYQQMAPSYQRQSRHWVASAKQEITRRKRLDQLIEDSRNNQRLKQYRR